MNANNHTITRPQWFTDNWRWLLALSVLLLFTDNALYNAPLLIMSMLGILVMARHLAQRDEKSYKWFFVCFLALWLPQAISLVDAVEFARSIKTVASYPAYMLAAAFIYLSFSREDLRKLYIGIISIISIWVVDALLGWAGLESWLGYKASGVKITGILYSKSTLGHIAAVLSPFVFDYIRKQSLSPWRWLLLLGTVTIILLSGRRVAWMMFVVAGCGYMLYMIVVLRQLQFKALCLVVGVVLMLSTILFIQYKPFHDRVNQTLALFSTNTQSINMATSYRWDIWDTAITITSDNWINGIGPRGFRYVYKAYADEDGHFKHRGDHLGPTHPHQFLLEIATETGVVGVMGYILFWIALVYALRDTAITTTGPYALTVIVALFPLNAHLAFYGSYWTAFVWWLLGILFAVARINAAPEKPRLSATASGTG